MSGTNPGFSPTLLAAPVHDDAQAPARSSRHEDPASPEDGVSLAELSRSVKQVERKADRALLELDGEGLDPGARGRLYALELGVAKIDRDLEEQRREISAEIRSTASEMNSALRDFSTAFSAAQRELTAGVTRLEARRIHPLERFLLVLCALTVAGATAYGLWVQL